MKRKGLYTEGGGAAIAVDGNGNVYVAGGNWGGIDTNFEYATIKYNSSGDMMWERRYCGSDSTSEDEATALTIDENGNVYVTGKSYSGTNLDYATIKYNSLGDTMWVRRYNGPGNGIDCATGIAVDNNGNVYVTGCSDGLGTYPQDYATIKYNSSGTEEWVQRYDGPGGRVDEAFAIAVDNKGYVYVTGTSDGIVNANYATIKYSVVGVEENNGKENAECLMLNAYPNPFYNTTILRLENSRFQIKDYKIQIYDIAGKLIETTKDNIIGKELKPGIYFVKVNNYESIKMIKVGGVR